MYNPTNNFAKNSYLTEIMMGNLTRFVWIDRNKRISGNCRCQSSTFPELIAPAIQNAAYGMFGAERVMRFC